MAVFRVERASSLPPAEAWDRITDWAAQGRFVPLTRIRTSGVGLGSTFVARTAVGPVGFDDPMEVTEWVPPAGDAPGRCRIEKRGRVMLGWAEITVEARGSGSTVVWVEDIGVRGVPSLFDPVTAATSRLLFGRVVRGLVPA